MKYNTSSSLAVDGGGLHICIMSTNGLSCGKGKHCLYLLFQTLVSIVNSFHEKITALEEKALQLEKISNDASKASISRSMTAVWQRWTRLRNVAQEQEKILEDAVQEWKGFNDKVISSLGKSSLIHRFSLIMLPY